MCAKTPEGCRQYPGTSGHISSMHRPYPTEILCSHHMDEQVPEKLRGVEKLPKIPEGRAGREDIDIV